MGTCKVTNGIPMEPLIVDRRPLIHPAQRSPEVLGAASGGGSRALIIFYIRHSPRDANTHFLDSIIEIQAFLVTLIRKFDITHADYHPQIRRA